MKIEFEDKSYIDFQKSDGDKLLITILAKDHNNGLKNIINCVEISQQQLKDLVESLNAK